MATCGKEARARARRRSRARKEASTQEVRGYYKQFAEAKHLEWKSWIGNEGFLISLIRGMSNRRTMWPDDGYSPLKLTSKVTSSGRRPEGYCEVCNTSRRITLGPIPLLPQDQDFGRVASWQPAKVWIFSTLISKKPLFKDSLMM